jgi:xanthine dehydrogenase molybdopterin-binding subunit B
MARAKKSVGRNVLRKEGVEKVSGTAHYIDDVKFPGMLHGGRFGPPFRPARSSTFALTSTATGFTIVDYCDIPGRTSSR